MKMEHLLFLDSVSFLTCPLSKLPEAFGLKASISGYPHHFNTEENLDYVGPIPDFSYYGANKMFEAESRGFLAWYEGQKNGVFDNRRVLESYCEYDVTFLRQACRVFRREFILIRNIEFLVEAITIASACNKVFLKSFLKPDTIHFIPTGVYSGNVNYRKKALMWMVYREMMDGGGRKILQWQNGRKYRLQELPHFIVDGFCLQTRNVYEFLSCYYHGHNCQPYRDYCTRRWGKLAERYERTVMRIEQIRSAGYHLEVQCECEFDEEI